MGNRPVPCSLSGSETKAGVSGRIEMQRPLPGHRESSSRSTDQPVRRQGPGLWVSLRMLMCLKQSGLGLGNKEERGTVGEW